jgi:uncharacterized protein YndB with AHSA1/START domain
MVEFQASVLINKPPKIVFNVVGNPKNDPLWASGIEESERRASNEEIAQPVTVGSEFSQKYRYLFIPVVEVLKITEYESDRKLEIRPTRTGDLIQLKAVRTVEAVGELTRVTISGKGDVSRKLKLPYRWSIWLMVHIAKKQLQRNLQNLKSFLESQP